VYVMRSLQIAPYLRRGSAVAITRAKRRALRSEDYAVARTHASHAYEHLSKHRSKAKTGRTGSNDQTGAPRASFHIRCSYDVKLHRPIRNTSGELPGRLEPVESGGTRPARVHP
jgi:hypothetical protein